MTTVTDVVSIAIIEDDEPARDLFARILSEAYPDAQIDLFGTLEEAGKGLAAHEYSLVITDIDLGPGRAKLGGFQVLNQLNGTEIPVLVVSGLPEREAIDAAGLKALSFDLAAWDYLSKPVNESEFLVKTQQALEWQQGRKNRSTEPATIADPDVTLDPLDLRRKVTWKGQVVPSMSLTRMALLNIFLRNVEKEIPFDAFYTQISTGKNKETLRVHISDIKAAFREVDPAFNRIREVPLIGYKWSLS